MTHFDTSGLEFLQRKLTIEAHSVAGISAVT
jgi:hypothetical protein